MPDWPSSCLVLNKFNGVRQFSSGFDSSLATTGAIRTKPLDAPSLVPHSVGTWEVFAAEDGTFWRNASRENASSEPHEVFTEAAVVAAVRSEVLYPLETWLQPLHIKWRDVSAQRAAIRSYQTQPLLISKDPDWQ